MAGDPENNIVREWLRTLDLSHHLDNFIDNGYDDLETCKQIGEEDMDAIGVQEPRQREDLRQAVARLKQEGGTAVYFTLMGPDSEYIYEDEVAVDFGYGEDEDEKVHSMIDGGRSEMCDCNNCECLQDNHYDVQPPCYLDRNRWKWTEHHLRRGSYEGATEFRQMMRDRPGEEEVLVKKQRSASAVERGGFVEAIGGMSPHDQQRRMFRSLKVHVSCMSLFFLEIIKAPVLPIYTSVSSANCWTIHERQREKRATSRDKHALDCPFQRGLE